MKNLLFVAITLCMLLMSCSPTRNVTRISYQSFRTTFAQPNREHPIPESAEIILMYKISDDGDINVIVHNNTDEIMNIDQTQSFFVNPYGLSRTYYDPTKRVVSKTNSSSTSKANSVNLGSVASFLGVRGAVGSMLYGLNVGKEHTDGTSVTRITKMEDQKIVSLAPKSYMAMSKTFNISAIGENLSETRMNMTEKNTLCNFSFCISYSVDGGHTYKKIVTKIYSNSCIVVPVSKNEQLNEALRELYKIKPDAIYEPFYQLVLDNEGAPYKSENFDVYTHGILVDFK